MNTQGECPGLGAPAPSGREGNCCLWLAQSLYQRIYSNMKKEQEHTLNAIRECLAKNMPAGGKAKLFGSQARGTARDDSDWDILIILDKEKLMAADYGQHHLSAYQTRMGTGRGNQPRDVYHQGMGKV